MFRTVYVSQGKQLNIKNNWLIIKDDSKNSAIPLDDIQALIIDNLQTMISSYTLCMLAKNGINTILCNDKHLPACNILSLNIEPFRPLVDLYIHKNQKIFLEKLTKKHRLLLINLLNHTVLLKNKQFKLYIAIDKYINSFTAYINSQNIDNFFNVRLTNKYIYR